MQIADKTLKAIESIMFQDQGNSYRRILKKYMLLMEDAYREDDFPFRTHLGASVVGGECRRKNWFGFRWSQRSYFDARILRLFNRGHLEEAHFLAMLEMIGCTVYYQDQEGKQFKIKGDTIHFGGSTDGVALKVPDLEEDIPCLLEFKTSGDSPFKKLIKEGVKSAKFEHYIQMNIYMYKLNLPFALYMVVNKNTDALHAEIVKQDPEAAKQYLDIGEQIIFAKPSEMPERISDTPGWYMCKWCDYTNLCHQQEEPEVNCRTCEHSVAKRDRWECKGFLRLDKHAQLEACPQYERGF